MFGLMNIAKPQYAIRKWAQQKERGRILFLPLQIQKKLLIRCGHLMASELGLLYLTLS